MSIPLCSAQYNMSKLISFTEYSTTLPDSNPLSSNHSQFIAREHKCANIKKTFDKLHTLLSTSKSYSTECDDPTYISPDAPASIHSSCGTHARGISGGDHFSACA